MNENYGKTSNEVQQLKLDEIIANLNELNEELNDNKNRLIEKVGRIAGFEPTPNEDCEKAQELNNSLLEKLVHIINRFQSSNNEMSSELARLDRII